jgi:hypothetical protein
LTIKKLFNIIKHVLEVLMAFVEWDNYRADGCINLKVIMDVELLKEKEREKNIENIGSLEMFSDDNIENTLKTYNYDYGRLVRIMTSLIDSEELEEIAYDCKVATIDYIKPSVETFEELRQRVINKKTKGL